MRLAGRATELGALRRLRDQAAAEGPVVGVLTGPPGAGKTALLDGFCAEFPDDAVRRARAVPWESGRTYGVLAQLLGPDLPADPVETARVLADSPATVFAIDDAQWCDTATLRALSSATRHTRSPSLILLARQDEPGPDPELDELLDRTASGIVPVGALDLTAVRELASEHGVPLHPSVAERIRAHTGGIARHVVDLLAEVPAETWTEPEPVLPPTASVRADTLRRLDSCPPGARRLVEAVAVLGTPATLAEAVRLADLDDPVTALDEAAGTGLLTPGTRRGTRSLALPGPMAQAAVIGTLGVAERTQAHRHAAEIVEDPVRRLGHEVEATLLPDPSLAERLDALAGQRAAVGAWGSAGDLLIKASRLSTEHRDRDDRLLRGVEAFVGAGDVPTAATYTAEVESLRETALHGAVLGYLAIVRGRRTEAASRLARAWDLVLPEREPEVAARICHRYVLHSLAECRGDELVRWADRAVELAGPESTPGMEAQAIRGLGVAGAGRPADGMAGYLELAERTPAGAQAQRVRMAIGWLSLVLDRVDDAIAELETAVPTDFLGGSERISLWARGWLARARFARGEWDAALDTVHDALELASQTGITLITPLIHWTSAQVHALRGDWPEAEHSLRDGASGPHDYPIMRMPACLARAHYAEARADYAGVVQALTPLTRPWAQGANESGFWPWADVYANALVVQNRYDEAAEFLDAQERIVDERGQRSGQARLGYARGRLLGARGDLDAARESFENSLRLLEDLPLPYERARVNFAYGQALRRAGKRREADAVMMTARDLYARLGAQTYVLRCDRELKAAGLRTDRSGTAAEARLTPQERSVGELVAGGHSNKDVARELFLSPKTVQYHLTRIYLKLGIRSRGELAAKWSSLPDE